MIDKAWYAIAPNNHITERPFKARVNGFDYVVYRDRSQIVHAFGAFCPHRGCDLSLGSVENEEIVCAFHGWRFNGDGRCVHIPANRSQTTVPGNARLTPYAVCEKAGFVWIYTELNDGISTAPELVLFPELDQHDWTYTVLQTVWNAHFTRTVESVLDVSHLPFVHPEATGSDVSPVVAGPDYAVVGPHILIYPTPFAPTHPMEPVPAATEGNLRTEIELIFPNHWIIRTPVGDGHTICTYLTFTPRDEQTTDIFGVIMRNFNLESEFLDNFHMEHTMLVMEQDQAVIESLRPRMAPFELRQEAHVASDGPTIRYRVMLREALAHS